MRASLRGGLAALAVAGAMLLGAPASTSAQSAEETPEVLPAGPHRDETFYFCVACHSSQIISRQGMTRERWDETLHWMSEKQAMPALKGEERKLVLDYLAQAFPPKAPAVAGGWKSPFAPQ